MFCADVNVKRIVDCLIVFVASLTFVLQHIHARICHLKNKEAIRFTYALFIHVSYRSDLRIRELLKCCILEYIAYCLSYMYRNEGVGRRGGGGERELGFTRKVLYIFRYFVFVYV